MSRRKKKSKARKEAERAHAIGAPSEKREFGAGRCGKVRYRSESGAKKAIVSMKKRRRTGYGRIHAYICPDCGGWHVGHSGD